MKQRKVKAISQSGRVQVEGYLGRVVGQRYRIARALAVGGMGSVFVGEQLNLRG
jgi:hypothetical protein